MFEFSTARRYLWPKKRQISVSLIGILSIFVISLVVWLLLLFLSITEGIEKGWLNRLTALNGAIRITPTEEYYSSYYYQIDSISSQSNYAHKNIKEKLLASLTDPHSEELDEEVPFYWPLPTKTEDGKTIDLVKDAFSAIDLIKNQGFDLSVNDSEIAGALLRLRLIRPETFAGRVSDGQSFLTQASYFSSFPEKSKRYPSLMDAPLTKDINHLLYVGDESFESSESVDRPTLASGIKKNHAALASILSNIEVKTVEADRELWKFTPAFLPKDAKFTAFGDKRHGGPAYLILPVDATSVERSILSKGTLSFDGVDWSFTTEDQNSFRIEAETPLFLNQNHLFAITFDQNQLDAIENLSDISVFLSSIIQGHSIQGVSPWQGLYISEGRAITHFEMAPKNPPPWVYSVKDELLLEENGVILPKNYRDNNVLLGDKGFISYTGSTFTGVQELRIPIVVRGFYDPGIMAIGARVILCGSDLVRNLSSSSQTISLDPMMGNGIQIWLDDLKETKKVSLAIEKEFERLELSSYWKVTPFYEYGFAKDLMVQFQSDRYLFMIVGVIILFVACCNIVSLLLLLVNDKKLEIGILLSLGAKKRQIALIFGLCGIFLGILASVIGTLAGYFTMTHIDSLVHILNALEGQEAFNAAFYGSSLPKELSQSAALFIAIATPILSTISGLIPAIKACRLKPSAILRSE
jgi:lipoprotein-releasing system permease protein